MCSVPNFIVHIIAIHFISYLASLVDNPLALELDIYSLGHHLCKM